MYVCVCVCVYVCMYVWCVCCSVCMCVYDVRVAVIISFILWQVVAYKSEGGGIRGKHTDLCTGRGRRMGWEKKQKARESL